MSLSAMSLASCPTHGPNTLHEYGACVCCRPKPRRATQLESQTPIGLDSPRRRKREPLIGGALASDLSDLERRVYELYAQGVGPVAIGDRLGVGEFAAQNAIDRVVRKTGVARREELRASVPASVGVAG